MPNAVHASCTGSFHGWTIAHIPDLLVTHVLAKQPPEHREAGWIILLFSDSQDFRILLFILVVTFSALPFIYYLFHAFQKQTKNISFPYLLTYIICNTLNHLSSWKGLGGRCINVILGVKGVQLF